MFFLLLKGAHFQQSISYICKIKRGKKTGTGLGTVDAMTPPPLPHKNVTPHAGLRHSKWGLRRSKWNTKCLI